MRNMASQKFHSRHFDIYNCMCQNNI